SPLPDAENVLTCGEIRKLIPKREEDSHKGSFGKALFVGGSENMPGAVSIAAAGAVRSGVGLLTLFVPRVIRPEVAVLNPQATLKPADCDSEGRFSKAAANLVPAEAERFDAVAVGCGMGVSRSTELLVRNLIRNYSGKLILDADALNAIADEPETLLDKRGEICITPHPGEMCRLTGLPVSEILADPAKTALDFSKRFDVLVCLKSARTVTAFPEGRYFVNTTGGPSLSRGGSGDLLCGIMLSLAARMPLESAAPAANHIHGLAADLAAEALGENGADTMSTANYIAPAMRKILRY
nr:NAD(P)H-hydrate dehydratase [Clostridia bacterium]